MIKHLNSKDFYNRTTCGADIKKVIDFRSKMDFDESHICASINFDLSTEVLKLLKKSDKINLDSINTQLKQNDIINILLSAQNSEILIVGEKEIEIPFCLDDMFKELIAVQYCFILDETYCNFNKVYPFICTSPFSITSPEIRPYLCPCEIVHNLFLGHYPKLDSIEFLTQLGITHVLNISLENDYTLPEGVSRKFICVDDIESVELDFDDGVQFISRSLDKGGRVLVHCYLGISRSSSMIIAYLMWRYNIPLSKALVFVKNRRRIIRPNDGFLEQLIEYEAKLKESRKVCQVEESRKEDCEDQKKVCREDCNFDEGHKANDEMSCSSSSTPSETVSKGSTEEEEEEEVNFDEIPFPPNKEETECLLETVRKLQVKRGKGKMNSFENCVIF